MTLDPWQVATGCIGLLTGLLVWVGKRHISRLDEHDRRFEMQADRMSTFNAQMVKLEATMLTKADLQSMESRMMATLTAQHTSFIERTTRIESSTDKAHSRIDDLLDGKRS